jgi:hypothetical protein
MFQSAAAKREVVKDVDIWLLIVLLLNICKMLSVGHKNCSVHSIASYFLKNIVSKSYTDVNCIYYSTFALQCLM